MKKFTKIALTVMLAGAGISMQAQELGVGKPSYGKSGEYTTDFSGVNFYWGSNADDPTTIYFVNPGTTEGWDGPVECADVDLYIPGQAAPVTILATLSGVYPQTTPNSGTALYISCYDAVENAGSPTGEYRIVVPAGTVKDANGATNEVTEFTAMVCRAGWWYPLEVSPAEGDVAPEDFKSITVTMEGEFVKFTGITDSYSGEELVVELRDNNDWSAEPLATWKPSDININAGENSFTLDITGVAIEEGVEYAFIVPDSFFIFAIGEVEYLNSQAWCNYNVWSGMSEAEVLMGPERYTTPNLQPIELTWDWVNIYPTDMPLKVTVDVDWGEETFDLDARLVYIQKPEGGDEPSISTYADDANVLYIDITSLAEYQNVTLSVIVPGGIVMNEAGNINPEQTIRFTIYPLATGSISCEETSIPGKFELTWSIADPNGLYNNVYGPNEMYVLDATGDKIATLPYDYYGEDGTYSVEMDWFDWTNHVYFNLNGLDLEDGNYTVIVPEALIQITSPAFVTYLCFEAEISIIINNGGISTGVEKVNLNENDGIYRVYNLQGVKVMEGTDLNGLDNGLYIINGKKVIIR